jgi:hypothetical protein
MLPHEALTSHYPKSRGVDLSRGLRALDYARGDVLTEPVGRHLRVDLRAQGEAFLCVA